MKCELCGKKISFKNVDFDGFEHCPECGGVCMEDDDFMRAFKNRAQKIQFIKQVEEWGNDFS